MYVRHQGLCRTGEATVTSGGILVRNDFLAIVIAHLTWDECANDKSTCAGGFCFIHLRGDGRIITPALLKRLY